MVAGGPRSPPQAAICTALVCAPTRRALLMRDNAFTRVKVRVAAQQSRLRGCYCYVASGSASSPVVPGLRGAVRPLHHTKARGTKFASFFKRVQRFAVLLSVAAQFLYTQSSRAKLMPAFRRGVKRLPGKEGTQRIPQCMSPAHSSVSFVVPECRVEGPALPPPRRDTADSVFSCQALLT